MGDFNRARLLLRQFKGDSYVYGLGVLPQVGAIAAAQGKRAVLVRNRFAGNTPHLDTIRHSLEQFGVDVFAEVEGAAPNAPREDLKRITDVIVDHEPQVLVSFGGGSTVDCVKAAEVLRTLGGDIEEYFGTGLVTKKVQESGKKLTPHVAIQTASSSGAHLTKYSNITDVHSGQKKLIVDMAIVPQQPLYDYAVSFDAPASLTADGALDGIAHTLEVLYSAVGKPDYDLAAQIAETGIRLVVNYLPRVLDHPHDADGREALGLATDLGGYAIMVGGTSGAHLTSFSLIDVMSHGRACGMLNPYYTVFFAPAVEQPLRLVGKIFADAGYTHANLDRLQGRDLGVAIAEAMIAFEQEVGNPYRLQDVPAFTDAHITRALLAAKNPQLKMKLENMPVPLTAEMVDEYMGPILQAAKTGDLSVIKNVPVKAIA